MLQILLLRKALKFEGAVEKMREIEKIKIALIRLNLLKYDDKIKYRQMKQSHSKTLQKLPSIGTSSVTESKIFENNSVLNETKKVFMERFQKDNGQNGQKNDEELLMPYLNRPLIQLPHQTSESFTSFKKINKQEGKVILSELKNMRSRSTMLKPIIKAEILSNEQQYNKINKFCEEQQSKERELVRKKILQMTPFKMKKEVKIKEKYKNKTKNIKEINLYLNYRVYEHNLHAYKPYVDYDSMPFYTNQKIYFFGGRKHIPIVTYQPASDKWDNLPMIQSLKPFGQCKGSTISSSEILFFGGLQYFQQGFSLICNTIKIINLEKASVEVSEFPEQKVPCRAFHSQCTYGKFIIISGGIDKNNKLFHNFMNYNYEKKYWCELTVHTMPADLKGGFAKHQMLPIFHKRKNYSIYDDQTIVEVNDNIKEQGIYIFGGENSEADLFSKMFLMKLGRPSVVISELKLNGEGPLPRKNASMIYHKSYIIIHGGRNDQMKPFVLNSIHFLNLKTFDWIQVKGEKPPYRYSHTMMINAGQIVILGGKNTEGLCKEVFSMPYDQKIEYI